MQQKVHATHNIAGHIEYQHTPLPNQSLRYCFKIITYFRNEPTVADRDTLFMDFGDGTTGGAPRVNGEGEPLLHNSLIKYNIYEICHNYPQTGTYSITMQDPNRIGNIINMSNSIDTPFFLQNELLVQNPDDMGGMNRSPIFFAPVVEAGNLGKPYIYNPSIYDPDGDDLVFELITPLANVNTEVPGYRFPDEVNLNPPIEPNEISLDPSTGEFVWKSPRVQGIYTVAFLISEYRGGVFLGSMIYDFQITIVDEGKSLPGLTVLKDTSMVIGGELNLTIEAIGENGQNVILEAFGAPFSVQEPLANFEVSNQGTPSVQGVFSWPTDCGHLSSKSYTIVTRATSSSSPLSAIDTWQITLVPPVSADLQASAAENGVQLSWDAPVCVNSEKFRGYHIWRKDGCDDTDFTSSNSNLSDEGYSSLLFLPTTETAYVDHSATVGENYTYRVVAEYADILNDFHPLGLGQSSSFPSKGLCLLDTDIPDFHQNSLIPTFEIESNPAHQYANIQFLNQNLLMGKNTVLEAYNLQGKQMESWAIEANTEESKIEVATWQTGLYFLQLKVDGQVVEVKKLVVQ